MTKAKKTKAKARERTAEDGAELKRLVEDQRRDDATTQINITCGMEAVLGRDHYGRSGRRSRKPVPPELLAEARKIAGKGEYEDVA
jgi:hypothetical protein